MDQRKFLFATQSTSMVASAALWWLIISGNVELWHVYFQVAAQAAITAFDASVRTALFPRLVPRPILVDAVTLQSTAARASQFVGPAAGGFAIAAYGNSAPFILNTASSLALMAAVVLMRGVVPRTAAEGSSFRGEFLDGLRLIRATPVLSSVVLMEVVYGLFAMNPVMITIVARDTLGVGPEGLGGLLSAPALGALVGIAILLIRGQAERQGRFIILSGLAYAATLAVFAFAQGYGMAFAALVAVGFLDALMTVTRQSVVHVTAPGRMRGRIAANIATVTRGTGPLSQTQSGMLAGAIGPMLAVLVSSGVLALAMAAIAKTNPAYWGLRRTDSEREADDRRAALAAAESTARVGSPPSPP